MAKNKASGSKTSSSGDNVVRIKASSSAPKKEKAAKAEAVSTAKAPTKKQKVNKSDKKRLGFLGSIGGYFKGAWEELRQVRWPTRRATWGLTGAVLLYSAFFVVLVLLLDAGFKYLFELILGK